MSVFDGGFLSCVWANWYWLLGNPRFARERDSFDAAVGHAVPALRLKAQRSS